ncbi:MAG TPA: peptidase M16 [Acidobacteria bacterium]|nr:peptidase M16 [Acidobacteriota bacterium]
MKTRGLLLLLTLSLPGLAAAQAARVGDLRYPPLPPFEIARPERVVLDNGLVVMLLEDHELPLVEATALVRGGTRLDPPGRAGLADLAATVLRAGGTGQMTGDALDLWLENRAAAIEATAQEDLVRITLSSLAQDFPDALRVYADVLRRPAFDGARLEVARTQAISEVTRQNDEPDDILFREFRKALYGADSPYAAVPTLAGLRALGREDLVAWHGRTFQPQQIVLGLAGDFRRDEALRLLREAFGDWPRGAQAAAPEIPYRTAPNPGVFWVRKDDIAQSNLMIGHLGIRSDDPDYYAVEVLNQVLSGSFASRLINEVRTRKGLAYSVDGRVLDDWDHPGIAYLYASTKTATTGAGLQALLDEARGLHTRPPTAEEVEKAKQGLLGSFIFNVDSKREVLGELLTFELFGYPLDRLAQYRAGIEAVTLDQVRAAAVRHLRPEEFSLVVVGPAEGRDRPLTDFGKVTELDVTIE